MGARANGDGGDGRRACPAAGAMTDTRADVHAQNLADSNGAVRRKNPGCRGLPGLSQRESCAHGRVRAMFTAIAIGHRGDGDMSRNGVGGRWLWGSARTETRDCGGFGMHGWKRYGGRLAEAARGSTQIGMVVRLLVAGTACERAKAGKDGKDTKAAAPLPPPPTVVVTEVQQRTVPIVRDFVARTEAIPTVEVRARVAAVLEKVLYREGTAVKEGQILFELQRDEDAAARESAQARLAKAQADRTRARDTSVVDAARAQLEERKAELGRRQADVARYLPLAQARAIPQQDLETAQSQEKVAMASVEVANAALRDSVLLQRTQIELSEAAVQAAKASITQAELNLGYTTI